MSLCLLNISYDKVKSTHKNMFEVTEEWWGNYAERAFNVSLTSGATLNDGSTPAKYELAKQAFKIFVPNTSK